MKRTHTLAIFAAAALVVSAGAQPASAAPIQWPSNGHYYDIIDPVQVGGWDYALANVIPTLTFNGITAHAATFTSQDEFDLALSLYNSQFTQQEHWAVFVGAFHDSGLDPSTGWSWVTGESWNSALAANNWMLNSSPPQPFLWPGTKTVLGFSDLGWSTWPSGGVAYYLVEYEQSVPVPEPGTLLLCGMGLGAGIVGRRRRRL